MERRDSGWVQQVVHSSHGDGGCSVNNGGGDGADGLEERRVSRVKESDGKEETYGCEEWL